MPKSFENALIITNASPENITKADNYLLDDVISQLKNSPLVKDFDILNRPDADQFYSRLVKESLIITCGGDGTVNKIANYVINKELQNIILPLPFGGANDISKGLYGDGATLSDIMHYGTPDAAQTIQAEFINGDRRKTIRALGYIGIGISGDAAEIINNHRSSKFSEIGDILLVINAALNCNQFKYLDNNDNEIKSAVEILAIKHRMAKYIKSNDLIFKTEFTNITAENKLQIAKKVLSGMISRVDGKIIGSDNNIHITTMTPVNIQCDGEHDYLPKGTEIIITNGAPANVMRLC